LATNGLGLGEVGFSKYQSSNLVQKLIETTNAQPSTKAPLLPNPMFIPINLSQKGCKNCEKCDIRDNYSNHEINSPRLLDGFEADVVESTQSTLYILQESRP
jgi:hypothetical protein